MRKGTTPVVPKRQRARAALAAEASGAEALEIFCSLFGTNKSPSTPAGQNLANTHRAETARPGGEALYRMLQGEALCSLHKQLGVTLYVISLTLLLQRFHPMLIGTAFMRVSPSRAGARRGLSHGRPRNHPSPRSARCHLSRHAADRFHDGF